MSEDSHKSAKALFEVISSYPQFLHHEDNVVKTPYSVSTWMLYLDDVDALLTDVKKKKQNEDESSILMLVRDLIGRRAVGLLPKSYKLWKNHWQFVVKHDIGNVLQMWERALVTLHKFPRVWMEYLQYAHTHMLHSTTLRRLANRALEALPVTQHDKIWPTLLQYYQSNNPHIPNESKLCILRRYIDIHPEATKEVADFFSNTLGKWGEAALLYQKLLNAPQITPILRKDLWMSLAKICTQHPVERVGMDWDSMVRAVLANPTYLPEELQGVVWNQLADSWIRRGEFQLARSVYEEALQVVSKVRDFTILLDAYLQFEEGLLEATMQDQNDDEDDEDDAMTDAAADEDEDDWDILLPKEQQEDQLHDSTKKAPSSSMADMELALARAEDLTSRRPLLLNRVLLRQNPHDVGEWVKRARLYKQSEQPEQAAAALEEALKTVMARRAVGGMPSQLAIQLATVYEEDCKDLVRARDVFDRICNQHVYEFRNVDDLAECHAAWVELELRHETWDEALEIIRRSVIVPPGAPKSIRGLAKSLRLWDLLLDLEESLGTVQTTKDAYNRALELTVATPLHVLNFAAFLTEHKYFEESFTAFERGIEMFEFPGVKVIWKAYLVAFLKRYKGSKLERTRDLFQRCVEACPPEECSEFFLMNGKFEEEHGLTKRALGVYKQMCQKVPPSEKYTAYQLFIAKTTKYLGLTATRDIYQTAIEALEDGFAATLCLDFAKMETSLQEMDRARAVLAYGSQMADPRRNEEYWKAWNTFEVSHGNEETFREMLRIKRSVEGSFSTVNYNAAEMSGTANQVENLTNDQAMKMIADREGVELEPQQGRPIEGFVSASKRSAAAAQLDDVEERVAKLRKATATGAAKTPEAADDDDDDNEIDIEDDIDELLGEGGGEKEAAEEPAPTIKTSPVKGITTKAVPAGVFGGLAKLAESGKGEDEAPVGALERLKAAKGSN
jgi:pre-mRNA-splicing factor SYF1